MDQIEKLSMEKEVVIFSKSTCCMCHSIKALFYYLRVSPLIVELDEDPRRKEIELRLTELGCSPAVPAVFIGGKFVGCASTIMSLHLRGSLKSMLAPK
ncbi:hypothetical protein ACS0TY_014313 [Phlomoides rotata]